MRRKALDKEKISRGKRQRRKRDDRREEEEEERRASRAEPPPHLNDISNEIRKLAVQTNLFLVVLHTFLPREQKDKQTENERKTEKERQKDRKEARRLHLSLLIFLEDDRRSLSEEKYEDTETPPRERIEKKVKKEEREREEKRSMQAKHKERTNETKERRERREEERREETDIIPPRVGFLFL